MKMMKHLGIIGLVFVAVGVVPAGSQETKHFFSESPKPKATDTAPTAKKANSVGLTDLDAAEESVLEVWKRLPYMTRNVMFVAHKADVYGGNEERTPNVFTAGEAMLTYVEPIGYSWEKMDSGSYRFGISTDFEILSKDGKVLGGQKNFQDIYLISHYQNRQVFLNLTVTVDGIKPGDYVLAYILHDKVTGHTARTEQPFSIKTP